MHLDKRRILSISIAACVVLLLTLHPGSSAQNTSTQVGGGLDCNGFSPISKNIKTYMACTDPHGPNGGRFYDNGRYIGHDEPSVQFISHTENSGNNMVWEITLPKQDPTPTQSGSSVATFELTPTFWLSLALCDPNSYPQTPCTPDSDSNTGTGLTSDAGSALLELQFYPPGWSPFVTQISCNQTQWCASLNIDSLACTFNFANCNPTCEEPVNFAFLQTNGVPTGPPAPGQQTLDSFTPNSKTLLMNPGDTLRILVTDTPAGLLTQVLDVNTGQVGFMVASAASGFANTSLIDCSTTPFNFHPEYDTAKAENIVPWAALEANVNIAVETGHFELGANGDGDSDDQPCFPGPTIAGCLALATGGDLDFDGPPYRADWPDGSSNHPSPILIGALNGEGVGPMSFKKNAYSEPYSDLQFETDIPFSESTCNGATGAGCVVPPTGAAFYPFYSELGKKNSSGCLFTFGNDISGETTNDFGRDAQYGAPTPRDPALLSSGSLKNPCTP